MKNHQNDSEINLSFALVGNPNVGKSTLFNTLTGDNQHTGNWTGKTVEIATKHIKSQSKNIKITDLPGTYSLYHSSPEEAITCDFINSGAYDCVIIVANRCMLERSLSLVLQVIAKTNKAILCLNMADEHTVVHFSIDKDELSLQLGIPVVEISALYKTGIDELLSTACDVATEKLKTYSIREIEQIEIDNCNVSERTEKFAQCSKRIASLVIKNNHESYTKKDELLDKIFTARLTGIPIMLLVFGIIFWLTVFGANYPSEWLSYIFNILGNYLYIFLKSVNTPAAIVSILCEGIFTTIAQVVSVMLPPALIFFPLFGILEESGYLARVAFNLDRLFQKAGVNGKLSLTMMMGLGCNACGVMGCRIISSKKERAISAVTNSFMPCNGRFPTLIAIISIFTSSVFTGMFKSLISALILLFLIFLSFLVTLITSFVFSKLYFRDDSSSFIMELPSYKRPNIKKVIIDSLKNKVMFVLLRAVAVSALAGLIIWMCTNLTIAERSIISYLTMFFDPFGNSIGLDGIILVGFILGFPANEIVLPIIIMLYQNSGALSEHFSTPELGVILINNNWTITTAICVCVFCLFHFPCSTTCLSIKKETKSVKWTVASIITPLIIGCGLCWLITTTANLFHIFF